jgi:hypothetical protein
MWIGEGGHESIFERNIQQLCAFRGLNIHNGVLITIEEKLTLVGIGLTTKANNPYYVKLDGYVRRPNAIYIVRSIGRWDMESRWMRRLREPKVHIAFADTHLRFQCVFTRRIKICEDGIVKNCLYRRNRRNSP